MKYIISASIGKTLYCMLTDDFNLVREQQFETHWSTPILEVYMLFCSLLGP